MDWLDAHTMLRSIFVRLEQIYTDLNCDSPPPRIGCISKQVPLDAITQKDMPNERQQVSSGNQCHNLVTLYLAFEPTNKFVEHTSCYYKATTESDRLGTKLQILDNEIVHTASMSL